MTKTFFKDFLKELDKKIFCFKGNIITEKSINKINLIIKKLINKKIKEGIIKPEGLEFEIKVQNSTINLIFPSVVNGYCPLNFLGDEHVNNSKGVCAFCGNLNYQN